MGRQDGSFVFLTVAPGSYLLEVHDVHNVWPMVRVDVSAKSSGKIRAMLTHTKDPLALPITLEPVLVKPQWFEVRPPFQWTSMLMNPMVLMMGVTLLIMFAMPKMMANMDPEQLEEMKAMQGSRRSSRPSSRRRRAEARRRTRTSVWPRPKAPLQHPLEDPAKSGCSWPAALPLGAALDQICLGRRTVCFRCLL